MEKSVHMRAQHTVNENYVIGVYVSSLEYPECLTSLVSTPSQEFFPEKEIGQTLLK